jgi:hypothetical protein
LTDLRKTSKGATGRVRSGIQCIAAAVTEAMGNINDKYGVFVITPEAIPKFVT